jgi:ABC-type Fe3+/spermidine/putrescine transport system ATPase subunit
MNHLEGTLERDGSTLTAAVGEARFGIGRVIREAQAGERVRIGVRPEDVHPNLSGDGAPATCQTAMVLGHHLQVVAVLETGEEIAGVQRRAEDEQLNEINPGDKVWLQWSPTAALLLGPADGAVGARTAEPAEVQA